MNDKASAKGLFWESGTITLNEGELLDYLKQQVQHYGSQKALAHHLGVSPQYLSDVLHQRRYVGAKLLTGLGAIVEKRYYFLRGK